MSGSINKCTFIGNLGRDPETRTFSNGNKVCNIRLACSETWKDRSSGEKREATEWISVAIFSEGLIRVAEQYLKKGSKVYIEGKMKTRKYQDQSGADRYSTEIVLESFGSTLVMLDGRSDSVATSSQGGGQSQGGGYQAPAAEPHGFDDSDIPF